jgi:hypothetical protein
MSPPPSERGLLVIVPCGRAKIWSKHPEAGPTAAADAYIGAPFIVNREYALHTVGDWVILSAKYGFLRHLNCEDSGIWKCLEHTIRRLMVRRTAGALVVRAH